MTEKSWIGNATRSHEFSCVYCVSSPAAGVSAFSGYFFSSVLVLVILISPSHICRARQTRRKKFGFIISTLSSLSLRYVSWTIKIFLSWTNAKQQQRQKKKKQRLTGAHSRHFFTLDYRQLAIFSPFRSLVLYSYRQDAVISWLCRCRRLHSSCFTSFSIGLALLLFLSSWLSALGDTLPRTRAKLCRAESFPFGALSIKWKTKEECR